MQKNKGNSLVLVDFFLRRKKVPNSVFRDKLACDVYCFLVMLVEPLGAPFPPGDYFKVFFGIEVLGKMVGRDQDVYLPPRVRPTHETLKWEFQRGSSKARR